MRVYL